MERKTISSASSSLEQAASAATGGAQHPQGSAYVFSLNDSYSSGLRFDSHQDAIDFANKCVQDSINWQSIHKFDICSRYELLELEIEVKFSAPWSVKDFHLIFRAVPHHGITNPKTKSGRSCQLNPTGMGSYGDNDFVFVGITKLVQGPEKIIPSFVWLKRNHQIKDFFGQFFGTSIHRALRISQSSPEGEMGVTSAFLNSSGDRISGLVKRGTETIGGIENDSRQGSWHGFSQLQLMNLLGSVRAFINDSGVGVTFEPRQEFGFQFRQASLGVLDTVF